PPTSVSPPPAAKEIRPSTEPRQPVSPGDRVGPGVADPSPLLKESAGITDSPAPNEESRPTAPQELPRSPNEDSPPPSLPSPDARSEEEIVKELPRIHEVAPAPEQKV